MPSGQLRDGDDATREYILDMLEQLAKMAVENDDRELAERIEALLDRQLSRSI